MINNASGNLKEVLNWIADGVEVQYLATVGENKGTWITPNKESFALAQTGLKLHWRKKPNACKEAFDAGIVKHDLTECDELPFKAGWNAAIKHMENSDEIT